MKWFDIKWKNDLFCSIFMTLCHCTYFRIKSVFSGPLKNIFIEHWCYYCCNFCCHLGRIALENSFLMSLTLFTQINKGNIMVTFGKNDSKRDWLNAINFWKIQHEKHFSAAVIGSTTSNKYLPHMVSFSRLNRCESLEVTSSRIEM